MKQLKSPKVLTTIAIALIFVFLSAKFGFTVASIEEEQATIQSETFSAPDYVDTQWDKIMAAFDAGSQPLSAILSEMQPDSTGSSAKETLVPVAEKYGLITVGEAHVYMVEGTGTISAANTSTSLGTVEVTLDGYDGPIKVLLFVGTRIPSDESSLRDAVGFITFGDFKEQTEYGKVSNELNSRVLKGILSDLDRDSLLGKKVTFKGAFTMRTFNLIQIPLKEIKIVPVAFSVEG